MKMVRPKVKLKGRVYLIEQKSSILIGYNISIIITTKITRNLIIKMSGKNFH
jgi:hypothetical protein